mgnify:CR=1 FL=1
MYRTAIIIYNELPQNTETKEDEDGITEVWVHLGAAYAKLKRIDSSTITRHGALSGPIEDHINNFNTIE